MVAIVLLLHHRGISKPFYDPESIGDGDCQNYLLCVNQQSKADRDDCHPPEFAPKRSKLLRNKYGIYDVDMMKVILHCILNTMFVMSWRKEKNG